MQGTLNSLTNLANMAMSPSAHALTAESPSTARTISASPPLTRTKSILGNAPTNPAIPRTSTPLNSQNGAKSSTTASNSSMITNACWTVKAYHALNSRCGGRVTPLVFCYGGGEGGALPRELGAETRFGCVHEPGDRMGCVCSAHKWDSCLRLGRKRRCRRRF
jgi:hypothetical protein